MNEYIMKHLSVLVGGKITSILHTGKAMQDEYYGFRVQLKNGSQANVWIMGDEEGNSAGFLDIVEHVAPVPEAIKKYLDMNPQERTDSSKRGAK